MVESAAYAAGSPFVEGEVCEGVDMSAPVVSMLQGKHLLLGEIDWAPLSYPDTSQPRGWGGADIKLVDMLSEMLGFNYSIHDIGYPAEGLTWLDHFAVEVHNSDALLTYWTESQERIEQGLFVKGHVDLSLALLSRTQSDKTESWYASFYAWSLPFDRYLWLSIIFVVLASAFVDYLVERHDAACTYRESLYEYSAGVLWGGYGEPKSSCSAIYQVMISFFMLILISSYTANLAAFITLSAAPSSAVQSMDQAVFEKKAICVNMDDAWVGKLKASFPRAKWIDTSPHTAAGTPQFLHDDCEGMVVPNTQWRSMQMDPDWCHLHAVEIVSAPEAAGFATNFKSGCVAKAFSWAMASLIDSGEVEKIMHEHFPAAACSGSEVPAGSRRMAEVPAQLRWASAAGLLATRPPGGGEPTAREHRPAIGARRLATRSRTEVHSSSDNDDTQQMTISSFVGPFAVWGLLSVSSVVWTYLVPDSWKRLPRAPKACSQWLGQQSGQSSHTKTPGDAGSDTDMVREHHNPGHVHMVDIWSNTEETLNILRRLEKVCAASSLRGGGGAADGRGSNKVAGGRPPPYPAAVVREDSKVEWDVEGATRILVAPVSPRTPAPSISSSSARRGGTDWLESALRELDS